MKKIFECINGHFSQNEVCPHCTEKSIKTHDYQVGDCIKCGQLCQGNAYCCNSPEPIKTI